MAQISNIHNPSFSLFPINNNRTGWRPFGAPAILVVPHRRTVTGSPIANSQVFNIKVFIEDVPSSARVAGHDNIGLRFPDRELFAVNLDSFDLAERQIRIQDLEYYRAGELIPTPQAQTGDLITYTTSTGITDQIPYISGANYYDLSDIVIDFEHLPSDEYNLVYQAEYFTRLLSQDENNEFLCVDTNSVSLALYKFRVKHPGVVLEEFERLTPAPYLTNAERSQDTTLALYRPFTDSLENIYDEQNLLESINWVYDAPPEAIPYISQLLGWDVPYFPRSLDQLRKAVLRRTVEFQQFAGTNRAIVDLFRLFGFEILINNLWWSSDGTRLIRPDEKQTLGYENEQIVTEQVDQIETLLSDWSEIGFGDFTIPLLYRPQTKSDVDQFSALLDGGDVTVESYIVTNGSLAHQQLIEIAEAINNDPGRYGQNSGGVSIDSSGFLISKDIKQRLTGLQIDGYSQCLISGKLGYAINELSVGPIAPVIANGLQLDRRQNQLHLVLNGDLNLDNQSVFCFAIYKRYEYTIPDVIKGLQSNRFDIQVITEQLTEFADPLFLDFAIEFLYKIKAFHSLLNKIIFSTELNETYEVTDWCVGGDYSQRWDTDAGQLQVPPAIIPDIPDDITECSNLDPRNLGYKESDILLRLRKLSNLPEEFAAWQVLDARADQPSGATRLPLAQPAPNRDSCKFTYLGQDRVVGNREEAKGTISQPSPNANSIQSGFASNNQESPINLVDNGQFNQTGSSSSSNNDSSIYGSITREYTQTRQAWCQLNESADYCYKGRVDDELLYRPTILANEQMVFKPCSIDLGTGVYYTYPSYSIPVIKGVSKPSKFSRSPRAVYSGGANASGQQLHLDSIQGDYLTASYDQPLANNSMLSRLYRDYDNPQDFTLHYSDRSKYDQYDQRFNLAIARPQLNIHKPTLHLPGCRFPIINALIDDFYHPTWDARPWDDDFSNYCGPQNICGNQEPNSLNSQITVGLDGNEYLTFDQRPFQILGNGQVPDIQSLGDHSLTTESLFEENDVIHQVYMQFADKSHECLLLDAVCDYDTSVQTSGIEPGIIETDFTIFNSYAECGTQIIDFADGYPCDSGLKNYELQDLGKEGLYDEVMIGLGVPTISGTESPAQLLIFLRSGIRSEQGLRLDCGCLLADCNSPTNGYESAEAICSADIFLDDLNDYDWDMAHIQVNSRMLLSEPVGACSVQLDGSIGSLLETV